MKNASRILLWQSESRPKDTTGHRDVNYSIDCQWRFTYVSPCSETYTLRNTSHKHFLISKFGPRFAVLYVLLISAYVLNFLLKFFLGLTKCHILRLQLLIFSSFNFRAFLDSIFLKLFLQNSVFDDAKCNATHAKWPNSQWRKNILILYPNFSDWRFWEWRFPTTDTGSDTYTIFIFVTFLLSSIFIV